MQYKDYYEVMGLARDASQDEVKRAYRKLARKFHPDVSKEADAEARFKELGEAYEVLKDPEKRAAYDRMGADWKAGQDFRPPPGASEGFGFGDAGFADEGGQGGEFSDFFEQLFGRQAHARGRGGGPGPNGFAVHGQDQHARVLLDLEDVFRGVRRTISLATPVSDAQGHVDVQERTLEVEIPRGMREGQHLRLAGQGAPGFGGGPPGDLYLEIAFRPHPHYRVDGRDLYLDLPLAPWEAALGATVQAPTPEGPVQLTVPAGSSAGRKLRLRGRGIPGTTPGDLYVVLTIALPAADNEAVRQAYRALDRAAGDFRPRAHLGV
jgi:curved DNA-binding protein